LGDVRVIPFGPTIGRAPGALVHEASEHLGLDARPAYDFGLEWADPVSGVEGYARGRAVSMGRGADLDLVRSERRLPRSGNLGHGGAACERSPEHGGRPTVLGHVRGVERHGALWRHSHHYHFRVPAVSDEPPAHVRRLRDAGGTTNFSWDALNGNFSNGNPHRPWGIVREGLTTGLEATLTNYNCGGILLTSGYRCPHGNFSPSVLTVVRDSVPAECP